MCASCHDQESWGSQAAQAGGAQCRESRQISPSEKHDNALTQFLGHLPSRHQDHVMQDHVMQCRIMQDQDHVMQDHVMQCRAGAAQCRESRQLANKLTLVLRNKIMHSAPIGIITPSLRITQRHAQFRERGRDNRHLRKLNLATTNTPQGDN